MSDPRVLLLGAGLVAPPLVRYLLDHGAALTIAANNPDRARTLVGGQRAEIVDWQGGDLATLATLVDDSRVVISLLPATLHGPVAELCVDRRRHLVTASYVSPQIQALDARAREAGVVLLNELGVDPGIDHMSAMQLIDEIKARGGRILSFRSYCGGLPAPEANDNPWGYKFSWSPVGVLRAATQTARFRENGQTREVSADQLLDSLEQLTLQGQTFEAYPNRDALPYIELYGLSGVETMYRGTLRWPGWVETTQALRRLGLLTDDRPAARRWPATLAACAGVSPDDDLPAALAQRVGNPAVVERLRWLGLLDDSPLPGGASTVIEALAAQMLERMALQPGERDLLAMHHAMVAEIDGARQAIGATMVAYGEPGGDTAMARTVGLPAAIGARLVLEGHYLEPGVRIPVEPALYRPILAELAEQGIALEEHFPSGSRQPMLAPRR